MISMGIAREYGLENDKTRSGDDLEPYYIKVRVALDAYKTDVFGNP